MDDGPTVLRYPKGALTDPILQLRRVGGCDVLKDWDEGAEVSKVCIVALGSMVPAAMEAAALLENDSLASVRVVDPRWAIPKEFLQQASRASIVTALGLDAQGLSERIRHALAGE